MEENTQLDPKTEQGNGQNGTDDSMVSISREEYERFQGIERDYKASTREAQQLRAISEC
jgi:PHD/YefM family antitoxin component YafN of YafNO toxin-antitoxin module